MTLDFILLASIGVQKILGYLSVALIGSVKFFIGVIVALGYDYSMFETLLTAGLGAFVGVWILTYFGKQIRKWADGKLKTGTRSFARRRQIVNIWKKFGLVGVAFLAPLISPPVCVAVAVSFREKSERILLYMAISLTFWSVVFSLFRDTVVSLFG